MPLLVLGMGKLGGGELNFSSDIDLVFLFAAHGETTGAGRSSTRNSSSASGKRVAQLLGSPTDDGFVYRVDLRLRPFGDSGPVAVSFDAFEDYLQQHGRDWERYAYVKARPVFGGDHGFAELYGNVLRPFVYRRYLDFGVFESLREMKELIAREVERRELQQNVKLGPGGIREIEFIVQAFQLLRGGSTPRLQSRSLLEVLPQLAGQKLLPAEAVAELQAAYRFLRRVENRLQEWNDEQTHELPVDEGARARLALAMGLPGWPALEAELDAPPGAGQRAFPARRVCARRDRAGGRGHQRPRADPRPGAGRRPPPRAPGAAAGAGAGGARARAAAAAARQRLLPPARRDRPAATAATAAVAARRDRAAGRRDGGARPRAARAGADRRPHRVPGAAERERGGARAAGRALRAFAVPRRADRGVPAAARRAARRAAVRPRSRRAQELAQELRARMADCGGDDAEQQVDALRQFQRAAMFRIAVPDLTGRLPLMKVSDRLTDIAELLVRRSARSRLAADHRAARRAALWPVGGCAAPGGVIVVAYGKFGGIELGYGSDLDLVFLHDSSGEVQRTAGPQSVDNGVFFLRLVQRLVHLLTVHSAAGRLYEVDTRLRPSGKGGLLVQSIEGFAAYQRDGRLDLGAPGAAALARRGRRPGAAPSLRGPARANCCAAPCAATTLRDDVRAMRERMRAELSKSKPGEFDLKQDAGGITDIEFLAQYWTLLWAERHAELVTYSDNIRQLESLASIGLVPQAHGGRADGRLSRLPAAHAPPVAGRRRQHRAGGGVRRDAGRGQRDLARNDGA